MICAGCGCVFCPDSDGIDREPGSGLPRYCTRRCKKRASERRNGTYLTGSQRRLRAKCVAKTGRYEDEETARTALRSLWLDGVTGMTGVYQCPVCDLWHMTSRARADVRVVQRGEHGELTLGALRDLLAGEQEMTA